MKKVPKVLQTSEMDCGAACLLSILKYHGGNISYSKLKRKLHVNEKGTSAYELVQTGEALGFIVEGKKGRVSEILPDEFPCIAHLKKDGYYHFVVLNNYDSRSQKLYIMDPSIGYNNVSLSYWEEICTENYLFFKIKRFVVQEKDVSFWKILFPNPKYYSSFFYILIVYQFFSSIEFLGLLETKVFFSYLLTTKDTYNILHFFAFFFLFTGLLEGGTFLLRWLFQKRQNKTLCQLLKRWYRILLNLPYYYFERHEISEVQTQLELVEELYTYFFQVLKILCLEGPIILFCLVFFYQQSPSFLGLICFQFFLFLFIMRLFFCYLSKRVDAYLEKKEKRNSFLLDALGKFDFTKGLHQEKFFYQKLKEAHINYQEASYSLSMTSESEEFFKNLWGKGMHFLFLLFFLGQYFQKKVTIYSYFLLEIFFSLFISSFQKILEIVFLFPRIKMEARKLEELFTFQKEVFPQKSILPLNRFQSLKILSFSYQLEGKKVTSSFSCQITSQEKVVLHGASGSGKSTLCKMMVKLLPVSKNMIYLNQFDIVELQLEDLRKRVCYVSQEEGLFHGTLLENITLGKRVFSNDLQEVLKLTHVDRILKEKQITLDFPISALTMPFSGGERKKILLARTLLLKRDIYLLDEVFESIQKEEALELVQNVLQYLKDKIVFVVSHRSEMDDLFDQVLCLEVNK